MTPRDKYDEQVLIQEQREETKRILNTAEERGKRPVRRLDTLDARYIVREKRKGTTSRVIADTLKVSIRQVQRLWNRFKHLDIGEILYMPKLPGRHQNSDPGRREHSAVLAAFGQIVNGASAIYKHIKDAGDHIPKDRIHKVLLECKLSHEESAKKKQRKYVRYERKHSNTLWHTDYTQLDDKRWLIAYVDDSSRYILGHGIFENATSKNAIDVFKETCRKYGTPYSVMTDHGSQFYAMEKKSTTEKGSTLFEDHLKGRNIKHILARIGHPQTNGKSERVFKEYKYKIQHFADVAGPPGTAAPFGAPKVLESDPTARFIRCHNNKPHISLYGETPAEAYRNRMLPEGKSYKDDDG